jgi:hypothetical protein
MHSRETVDHVLRLCGPGRTTRDVARVTGVAERTISHWRSGDRRRATTVPCARCRGEPIGTEAYAYLLGTYLGDGHITSVRRSACLWIYCGDAWPGILREVGVAMTTVLPTSRVCMVRRPGCTALKSYSVHWLCYFPQHGPGSKHRRPIVLESWQREAVSRQIGPFLRGLFHSDGCRMTNWATRKVGDTTRRYEYPRYFFTNKSQDILGLCAAALDQLGIAYTRPRADTISVARRAAVAALDVHVGPKS